MKDNKKFFYNNRLNKGYSKFSNSNQTDLSAVRKKFQSVLPPIDMMEEYEEKYPGTFDKIFDMAEKEQNHRHTMDLLEIEKYNKASKMGRCFALIFIAIISITSLTMVLFGVWEIAVLLIACAFLCITTISFYYNKNLRTHKKTSKNFHNNSPRNKSRNQE